MTEDAVRQHLVSTHAVLLQTIRECKNEIIDAAQSIINCYRNRGKVLIAGNGGSAADAQHFAGEMMGWFLNKKRRGLPTIALTTDSSVITAVGNDISFPEIFARQVNTLGRQGDVFVALSTSGASPNILRAVRTADDAGLFTIGLSGMSGLLGTRCRVSICVPSPRTPYIQIAHAAILHAICCAVDEHDWGS